MRDKSDIYLEIVSSPASTYEDLVEHTESLLKANDTPGVLTASHESLAEFVNRTWDYLLYELGHKREHLIPRYTAEI